MKDLSAATPQDISIESVKVNKALSEETLCYTATLYVYGKPFCITSNRGHGGPDEHSPINRIAGAQNTLYADLVVLNKALSKFPHTTYPNLTNDLEMVVSDLLGDCQRLEETKKLLKRVTYLKKIDGKYSVMQLPSKFKPTPNEISAIKGNIGAKSIEEYEIVFLNDLSFEEAHKLLLDNHYT
jgi:hypothetical protein